MKKKILWGIGIIAILFLMLVIYGKSNYNRDIKETRAEIMRLKEQANELIQLPVEIDKYIEKKELEFYSEDHAYPMIDFDVLLHTNEQFEQLSNKEKYSLLQDIEKVVKKLDVSGCYIDDEYYESFCDYDDIYLLNGSEKYSIAEGDLFINDDVVSLYEVEDENVQALPVDTNQLLSEQFKEYHEAYYLQLFAGMALIEATAESITDGYISQDVIDDGLNNVNGFNEVLSVYSAPRASTEKDKELQAITEELLKHQKEANDALLTLLRTGNLSNNGLEALKKARELYHQGKSMGI